MVSARCMLCGRTVEAAEEPMVTHLEVEHGWYTPVLPPPFDTIDEHDDLDVVVER